MAFPPCLFSYCAYMHKDRYEGDVRERRERGGREGGRREGGSEEERERN